MAHRWRCFCLLSLHASGWGPPKFERAPQIKSLKLVCVVVENKKISRDVKGLFFRCLVAKELCCLNKQGALQLVRAAQKEESNVMGSWRSYGPVGQAH